MYREYGDCVCLGGAEADLLKLPECYHAEGGEFWVLVGPDSTIVGTHAAHSIDKTSGICGFRRLYLASELRGTGFGYDLMQVTIEWAWENGFSRIEFWSDTRFERAHKFFRKFGFEHDGQKREMSDGNDPYHEYFFYLERNPS